MTDVCAEERTGQPWVIRIRMPRPVLLILALVLLVGGTAGGWAGFLQLSGNFHPVVEGQFYRSAQLSGEALDRLIAEKGIRTIINLRGVNEGQPWYDEEVAVAEATGTTLINFSWSDRREPSDAEIAAYIAAVKESPKPILVHCKAGADRAGLASALYLAAIEKVAPEVAGAQLSFRYGHVSLPYTAAYPMTQAFQRVEHTFAAPRS